MIDVSKNSDSASNMKLWRQILVANTLQKHFLICIVTTQPPGVTASLTVFFAAVSGKVKV